SPVTLHRSPSRNKPSKDRPKLQNPKPNGAAAAVRHASAPGNPLRDDHAGRNVPPGLLEALTLVALLTIYGVFLILGTFVHTDRLGEVFAGGAFSSRDVFAMLTCWTWTNLLILCCLASVIGELGRRVLLGSRHERKVRAAIVRGFFILLAIMAGQLVVLGTPGASAVPEWAVRQEGSGLYANIRLERFFRLAAFASLASLLVSLKPRLIRVLIEHVL